jgi:ATP-dependent Clp protease ATP-binding subunit ClpX
LPVVTYLQPLSKDTLKMILTIPKNALIKQYKKLFAMEDIELEVSEDALDFIVEKALDFKLGARGLRSICEAVMTDAMFHLPSEKETKKFSLTRAYAEDRINKSKFIKQLKVA